jgi:hypothetical protein
MLGGEMVTDALQLKDFLTLGSNGLLTFFLYSLWKRLNTVTDVLIENGRVSSAERAVIAKAAGLTTQDLRNAVTEAQKNSMSNRNS